MNSSTIVDQPEAQSEPPQVDRQLIDARVDDLLAAFAGQCAKQQLPCATYRLQFNSEFTFAAAEEIIPYLDALGVSDVYASPFLQATPGSNHGYDVVDHGHVNYEIGSPDQLTSFAAALRTRAMGLLMDVVPNHMSTAPHLNAWWQDVLENGPSSPYATYFDIDWMPLKPDLAEKVLLPVLGDQFGKVLEAGQLSIEYRVGMFWLKYYEREYPLSPESWLRILDWRQHELQEQLGAEDPHLLEYLSILTAIRNLPPRTETNPERLEERHREKETSKRRLHALTDQSPAIAEFVAENVRQINGQPGDAASFDQLDQLLDEQPYRMAYWRAATDEINYRRFFDINELAAICMERPEVFEATHARIFEWIEQGLVSGLRIDHPDGLYDPPGYLRQLQERRFTQLCRAAAGNPDDPALEAAITRATALWREATRIEGSPLARPLYVVVEKILGHGEAVPEDWPVHGTVGYEFLNALGGLFVDPAGEKPLSATFTRFTGESLNFRELEYSCKRLIARMSMASELHVLGYQLDRMSERNRRTRDFTLASLIEAVQEVISCFSVYRTYIHDEIVLERDRQYIESAVARAKRRNPAMDESVFDFLRDVLLLRHSAAADAEELEQQLKFVCKFQQLSGPIMAKAVEDTAFYRFNRLVSLNEVGGEPARFGTDVATFHTINAERLPRLSHGLSTTTTHDTKRSEDVRARISVLSEVPREWRTHVMRWARWHRRLKTNVEGVDAPSRNDEYLLYQTLVGVWPGEIPRGEALDKFTARMEQYLLKVAREAKVHTSWISQNVAYEQALQSFVQRVLSDSPRRPFLEDLDRFTGRVAEHGYWNSLSQLLLKIASPGVPDIFQGTERWNLTLVDPDNRGAVEYGDVRAALQQLEQRVAHGLPAPGDDPVATWIEHCLAPGQAEADQPILGIAALVDELLWGRRDGRIKLFCTQLGLRLRRRLPEVFTGGAYVALGTAGPAADNAVAFARVHQNQAILAVAPRCTVRLAGFAGPPPVGDVWSQTSLSLPGELANRDWCDVFTGRRHRATDDGRLELSSVLAQMPVALLAASPI